MFLLFLRFHLFHLLFSILERIHFHLSASLFIDLFLLGYCFCCFVGLLYFCLFWF